MYRVNETSDGRTSAPRRFSTTELTSGGEDAVASPPSESAVEEEVEMHACSRRFRLVPSVKYLFLRREQRTWRPVLGAKKDEHELDAKEMRVMKK